MKFAVGRRKREKGKVAPKSLILNTEKRKTCLQSFDERREIAGLVQGYKKDWAITPELPTVEQTEER